MKSPSRLAMVECAEVPLEEVADTLRRALREGRGRLKLQLDGLLVEHERCQETLVAQHFEACPALAAAEPAGV